MKDKSRFDLVKFQSMKEETPCYFNGTTISQLHQWWLGLNHLDCHNEKDSTIFPLISLSIYDFNQDNLWPNFVHFFPSLPLTQFSFPFICDGVCTRLIIYRNLQYLIIIQAFFTLTYSFRATICPLTPQDNVKASNDEKCSYQAGKDQQPCIILHIKR